MRAALPRWMLLPNVAALGLVGVTKRATPGRVLSTKRLVDTLIAVDAAGLDRRCALVEAAFQSVARAGFEGLRLREVAAAVGIDHSTIHHYFATKQELVNAVVAHATGALFDTIPSSGSRPQRLRGHLRILASMIESRPDLFVVLAEIDLRARRDAAVAQTVGRIEQGWRHGLAELVDRDDKAVESVIATVKGVRLDPAVARPVLDRLADTLIPPVPDEG